MFFNRTFHPDEANQAFTTAHLLETGRYTYRPDDHHGPTLYYAAATIQKAAGHNTLATMDGTLLRCTPLLFAVLALLFGFLSIRKLMKPVAGVVGWLVPGLFVLLLGTAPIFAFPRARRERRIAQCEAQARHVGPFLRNGHRARLRHEGDVRAHLRRSRPRRRTLPRQTPIVG